MPRSTPIRYGSVLLAAGALIAATACGGDDDGESSGGSTEEFCDDFAALADTDAEPEQLRSLADSAPSEVSDAMNRFVEIADQMDAFDEENASEEDLDGFFSLLTDLEESSTEIEAFLVDNCPDLPPGLVSEE